MAELGELFVKVAADTKGLKTGLDSAEKQVGGFSNTIKKHHKAIGIAMTAIGGSILAMGVLSAKSFAKFEAGMREVNSMMGLGQEEFKVFSAEVRDLTQDIGIDAVKATKALYQAISAGIPRENAIEFLRIASKAAIAGVTETEVAVDGLTTVINAFKMPLSDTQKVADILFQTVKGGKTTFEELSASLFNVAPIAAASNIRFEEVAAALASMTKQGVPTKIATTQLRQAMVALQKPTTDMSKAIEALGYSSGEAMLAELGFAEAIQKLKGYTQGSNEMLMTMFGSVEGGAAILALTGLNAKAYANDIRAIEGASEGAGAATEAFNEINKGASRQFEIAKAKIQGVAITLGETLMPAITTAVTKISEITSKVSAWIKEHPELTKVITITAMAIGGLLVVLGPMLIMLPFLASGITMLGVAFHFALGPIGLIILAIGALIAIGIIIWQNWDSITRDLTKWWTTLKETAKTVFGAIGDFIMKPVDFVIELIAKVKQLWTFLMSFWRAMFGMGRVEARVEGEIKIERAKIGFAGIAGYEPGGRIELMQEGGIVTQPTLAMLGERGAEAVIPLDKGLGMNLTINFTEPVFMEREESIGKLANKIYKIIKQDQRLSFGSAYGG